MVKYSQSTENKSTFSKLESRYMDMAFGALNDATRREILERLAKEKRLTVTEIASPYVKENKMSLPAVSKHIKILGQSGLIDIKSEGRMRIVIANPKAFLKIQQYMDYYTKFWNTHMDYMETYLKSNSKTKKTKEVSNG
jgi:DNA-binding transcriptional ArsR family regulator